MIPNSNALGENPQEFSTPKKEEKPKKFKIRKEKKLKDKSREKSKASSEKQREKSNEKPKEREKSHEKHQNKVKKDKKKLVMNNNNTIFSAFNHIIASAEKKSSKGDNIKPIEPSTEPIKRLDFTGETSTSPQRLMKIQNTLQDAQLLQDSTNNIVNGQP